LRGLRSGAASDSFLAGARALGVEPGAGRGLRGRARWCGGRAARRLAPRQSWACCASSEFVRVWDQHEVAVRFDDPKTIVHSELGHIELDCQFLSTENRAQALLVFTPSPGTEGHEKLQLLSIIGSQQFTS